MKVKVSAVQCKSYDKSLVFNKLKESVSKAGGFPVALTKKSKVLIKPNFLTAQSPDKAITTHPEIVRAIIKLLREQNISDITIGDSPAGKYTWEELWTKTGFANLAKEENVKLLPFINSKKILLNNKESIPILSELSSFDFIINVPKLKTHTLTKMTGAVKNCYGLMIGGAKAHFHGKNPSPKKMSAFLAEFYQLVKPDFTIMDAIIGMEGNGPVNGKPKEMGVILAGTDALAIDACACGVFGYKYNQIPLLLECEKLKIGIANSAFIEKTGDGWDLITNCNAKKSKTATLLGYFPENIFHLATSILSCKPKINTEICIKCGKCLEICPKKTIKIINGDYNIKQKDCILCMCCIEACPQNAIELLSIGMKLKNVLKIKNKVIK